MNAADIRLRRTNPADGHRDGKLHCLNEADWWTEHDDAVFIIENRDGVCAITLDMDLLHRLATRHNTYSPEFHKAIMAWLDSAEYDNAAAVVVTLRSARTAVADILNSPTWPASRDAYRALLAWARGDHTQRPTLTEKTT